MAKSSYRADNIEVLEGLDPVRKRPGMYIGGTDGPEGLHHLFREILDNAIDEAMNGFADRISVILHEDHESITVEDNGRGIPVDIHPKIKKPAVEVILTTLHSGGKFSDLNYRSAGGLHGVGASVVNALSSELIATITRDGHVWEQSYSKGKPQTKLKKIKSAKGSSTRIFFRPDTEIFSSITFSLERLESIVEEKALLNRGLTIQFLDQQTKQEKVFCFPDGISTYLEQLLAKSKLEPLAGEKIFLERANGIKAEVAFCWTESTQTQILSYVNGIRTNSGGTHEDGFRTGLMRSIRNYLSVHDIALKGVKISADDMREGLLAVLSVNVPGSVSQLQFQGQTKDRLNNPEIAAPVEATIKSFENYLNSKPSFATALIERISLAAKAREAARSASKGVSRKVGISHRLTLPGKLADCSARDPDEAEIFIVEGDSAGGTAKQARDRRTQAVLPLRGKVLNAISASGDKVKENKELVDLITALGCGFGDHLDLKKLRYDKVIILTDADADGMHIATLLMAFFFKFLKPIVEQGHLYLGLSPLYRIRVGSGEREELHWVYTDAERDKVLKQRGATRKVHVTRFKGLGEMNPKTLWETTLDPKCRNLLRVAIEDPVATEQLFESLLGRESAPRFQLIQENAHRLELDL